MARVARSPRDAPGMGGEPRQGRGRRSPQGGAGKAALKFLQPLSARDGRCRSAALRVIQHGPTHLVGAFLDVDGVATRGIVSPMSFDWLANYCPNFFARRPRKAVTVTIEGTAWENTPDVHLDRVLGRSADEILHGATAASFGVELQAVPAGSAQFMLNVTCPSRESLLIARGFVPQAMEERWFVFLSEGRLCLHRRWTGILVYEVEATWRGDRLHLGHVRANRDPAQYGETEDIRDAAMLRWIIDMALRGVPSTYPMKGGEAQRQARAAARSASLQG